MTRARWTRPSTRARAAEPPKGARWPNLFLVGAGKAGTTSLWHYLDSHPDISMSRVKEPHFFSRGGLPGLPVVKSAEAYLDLFAGAGQARYRGEASPSYLCDEGSARAIKAACSS